MSEFPAATASIHTSSDPSSANILAMVNLGTDTQGDYGACTGSVADSGGSLFVAVDGEAVVELHFYRTGDGRVQVSTHSV